MENKTSNTLTNSIS